MSALLLSLASAWAEDPPAAAASTAPTLEELRGKWWFTSTVEGKEAVGWACQGTPHSVQFDDGTLVLSVGAEPIGAAIRTNTAKGDALELATTVESCAGKAMTVRWADPAHKILAIARCEGTRATVRAVRDLSSGVPVLRQCCDAAGKSTGWAATETPCRSGDGQKPTPLRR